MTVLVKNTKSLLKLTKTVQLSIDLKAQDDLAKQRIFLCCTSIGWLIIHTVYSTEQINCFIPLKKRFEF